MAHQLSSCLSNLSSTNLSKYQNHPSRPLSYKPKPSHFQVKNSSSNSSSPDDESFKIDRRKMVLGLGASNLIIPGSKAAFADDIGPLLPPSFTSCSPPENATGTDPLPANTKCCLPPSDNIKDFVFPRPTILKKRRPAHSRKAAEDMKKYARAVAEMKKLSDKDPNDPIGWTMQANVHCAYCNHVYHQTGTNNGIPIQIHFSWLFFPFHRWYLYFYERILGSLINDPTFALPFWNWDNPQGMGIPPLFQDQGPVYGALYDTNRDIPAVNASVLDYSFSGATDDATRRINNCSSLHTQIISAPSSAYDFMGTPYCQGTEATTAGQGQIESNSHGALHFLVGDSRSGPLREDMGNFYSAGRDPVFYSHHANVDRLWSIWSKLPTDYDKKINSKNFLEASFLFYNEKRELVRVNVKDSLDHRKMGYVYEHSDISCWLQSSSASQSDAAKDKITEAKSKAPKAETVFPLKLKNVTKVVVKKAKTGHADEILVLEDIAVKSNRFAKFDVFVNDEDEEVDFTKLDKAAYAGSFTHVPLGGGDSSVIKTFTRLRLTNLYNKMDLEGDDTIVVTLVPRRTPGDQTVTIGAIKVIEKTQS